jgi:hypothetical protein
MLKPAPSSYESLKCIDGVAPPAQKNMSLSGFTPFVCMPHASVVVGFCGTSWSCGTLGLLIRAALQVLSSRSPARPPGDDVSNVSQKAGVIIQQGPLLGSPGGVTSTPPPVPVVPVPVPEPPDPPEVGSSGFVLVVLDPQAMMTVARARSALERN